MSVLPSTKLDDAPAKAPHCGVWSWRRLAEACACVLLPCGVVLLALWLAGVLHSTDSSCMQSAPLAFGIASKWKRELGWVCCDNEALAEPSGWWEDKSELAAVATAASADDAASNATATLRFYDAACGDLLFEAPVGRSMDAFLAESRSHGWPSFRADEVVKANVKEKHGGEVVSKCGTHLGHNLPDGKGDRYCINLLCVAGTI